MQKILNKARTLKAYPSYWGRILFPDTMNGAKTYNTLCKILNWREYQEREKLLPSLLAEKDHAHTIPVDKGFLISDMSDQEAVKAGIEYALKLADNMDMAAKMKDSQKSFLLNQPLDMSAPEHEPLLKLATDKIILTTVAEYLREIPVLASVAIWYSPNDGDTIQRSQLYHMDGEDSRQIKCFIPLKETTKEHGPLTVINAKDSEKIYKTLKAQKKIQKRNEKLEDDLVYNILPRSSATPIIGKPGTVAFADTSRCYHYGSRPAKYPRLQLHVQYYTAYSMNMPLWGRKPNHLRQEENDSSPLFQAVVGLSHLDFAHARQKLRPVQ